MKRLIILFSICIVSLYLCACSKEVADKNMKIKIADNTYNATYTGIIKNNKPSENGKIKITDYVIQFDGVNIIGNYDGDCLDGLPEGSGTLTSKDKEYSFYYRGEWSKGALSGEGYLKYDRYVVHFDGIDREGDYVGDTVDGVASGYGTFKATNDYDEQYTYEGEWLGGLWDGFGRQSFEDEGTVYRGYYTKGDFESSLINMLYTFADESFYNFNFSDDEEKFINENSFLFPNDNVEVLDKYINYDYSFKMLEKNEENCNDGLYLIEEAYVAMIEEGDGVLDETMSVILLIDYDGNYYFILYPSEANDIYSDDIVACVGYPIGYTSIENEDTGESAYYAFLLGSFIAK